MLKTEDGIIPVREAFSMINISSLERFPISGGTPPSINIYQHNQFDINVSLYLMNLEKMTNKDSTL